MEKPRPRSILLPAVSTDPESLDADFFWEAHWKKFVAALIAAVIGILAVGAWSYYRSSNRASAAALYAAAGTPEAWHEVVAKYPGSLAAGNARLRIAAALRGSDKLDDAAAELEAFTADQPDHPLAGAAWLSLGEIRQMQNNSSGALEAYRNASGRYQGSYAAPLALLAEAKLLAAGGKPGESQAVLQSIGASYPETPAAMMAAAELAAVNRPSGNPGTNR